MEVFSPIKSVLIVFLLLLSCSECANNSSSSTELKSSSTSKPLYFPTIAVGKDETSLYYVNFSFGTPEQRQALRIDIAQPYIWLLSDTSLDNCHTSVAACNSATKFTSNDSNTAITLNSGYVYNFDFLDTIVINGTAVTDNINITHIINDNGSINEESSKESPYDIEFKSDYLSISNVSFFDTIYASYLSKGSLGLGAKISSNSTEIDSAQFDNSFFFLDLLKDMGIIEGASYSLWLGADDDPNLSPEVPADVGAYCGKLILGAVDSSLYSGDLTKFKMMSSYDPNTSDLTTSYPILPMGPIYIVSNTGKSLNMTAEEFLQPVLLDSRYGTNYLPLDTIVQIALQVGANFVESVGKWLVPCSVGDLGVTLNFTFADTLIQVPLTDFLTTTYDSTTNSSMYFPGGSSACFLTMLARTRVGFNVLGGAFLRSIYLAVDLEDRSIAIAQAVKQCSNCDSSSALDTYTSSSTNATSGIRAISSGHIPYATQAILDTTLYFSQDDVPSVITNIPDQLTATVYSDGLISTGRSFYDTSRSNTSPTTTSNSFESFLFTNSSATQNIARSLVPPSLNDQNTPNAKSLALLVIVGIFATGLLL